MATATGGGEVRMGRVGALGLVLTLALAAALTGCGGDDREGGEPASPPPPTGAPAANEGLFTVGVNSSAGPLTDLGLDASPLPEQAELSGPHYALVLDSVAVTGELTAEQVDELLLSEVGAGPLPAGPGQELLVVMVGEADRSGVQSGPEPTVEVLVAGQTRQPSPGLLRFVGGVLPEYTVLVVSVPAGEDAVLTITDAGQTGALSLRTGLPPSASGSAVDGMEPGLVSVEDAIYLPGITAADRLEGVSVSLRVVPETYVEGRGDAPDGRIWLNLELTVTLVQCDSCAATNGELVLDLARSLAIRTDDGTELELPDERLEPAVLDPTLATIEWSGAVEAPSSVRSIDVSFATTGDYTTDSGQPVAIERSGPAVTDSLDLASD